MSGGDSRTTHNHMYLITAITALEALDGSCMGLLYTDSKYLCDGDDDMDIESGKERLEERKEETNRKH